LLKTDLTETHISWHGYIHISAFINRLFLLYISKCAYALFKLSSLLETLPYQAFKQETIKTMIGTKTHPFCISRDLFKCFKSRETTNYRFSPFDSTNFLVFLTWAELPELEDLLWNYSRKIKGKIVFCKKKHVSVGEAVVKFHNIQKCSGHLLVNVNNGMEKRH